MAFARAFSTRRKQPETPMGAIGRAASTRNGKPLLRSQISAPVALVSTTNMLSYNAPDISGTAPVEYRDFNSLSSAASSHSSGEDSDASTGSIHSHDTAATELSTVDASPIEPNHLSCYFKPAVETNSPNRSPTNSTFAAFDAPHVPQRAPSHSKKAHVAVSRQRSVQRLQSPPISARDARADLRSPVKASFVEAPRENPFGQELAQLDEVAEEFGHTVRDAEAAADIACMKARGLARFTDSDYLAEIHDLISIAFAEEEEEFGGWI